MVCARSQTQDKQLTEPLQHCQYLLWSHPSWHIPPPNSPDHGWAGLPPAALPPPLPSPFSLSSLVQYDASGYALPQSYRKPPLQSIPRSSQSLLSFTMQQTQTQKKWSEYGLIALSQKSTSIEVSQRKDK